MEITFKNKIVLVTGASRGIGAATAQLFAESGATIPGAALREMRKIVELWGSFWSNSIDKNGNVIATDDAVSRIYQKVREWGQSSTLIEKAALMQWRPKQGDGFALKMHAIFALGHGPALLGYHPDVEEWYKRRTSYTLPSPALAMKGKQLPLIVAKSS